MRILSGVQAICALNILWLCACALLGWLNGATLIPVDVGLPGILIGLWGAPRALVADHERMLARKRERLAAARETWVEQPPPAVTSGGEAWRVTVSPLSAEYASQTLYSGAFVPPVCLITDPHGRLYTDKEIDDADPRAEA